MDQWDQAEEHARRAHEFYETGQWEQAIDELKRALAINPFESEWHFGLGLALDQLERYDEAAASFEQVIELRGEEPELLLQLGSMRNAAGDPRGALRAYERAAELDPACEASYCGRIAAYTELGEHEDAELMFYLARQLREGCPRCLEHLGQSFAERRLPERAIWCWREALRLDGSATHLHRDLARAYRKRGELERARQAWLSLLRDDVGDVEALRELADLLVEMKQIQAAAEKLRLVTELDPTSATSQLQLAELAMTMGQWREAVSRLRLAQQLEPTLAGPRLRLAQVAMLQRDPRQARGLVSGELRCTDRSLDHAIELGWTMLQLGMDDALRRRLIDVDAAETPRQRAELLALRGVAMLRDGKLERGLAMCRAARRLEPSHQSCLEHLVEGSILLGRRRQAATWLRRLKRLTGPTAITRRLWRRMQLDRWRRKLGRRAAPALRIARPRPAAADLALEAER